jgi:murein DD-endopeptidase MepM/ murein hydrolase activator NlpD
MATSKTFYIKYIFTIGAVAALVAAAHFGKGAWQRSYPKPAGPVKVTAQPGQVWIEAGDTAQSLNFDFLLENQGTTPMGIDSIEVTAFDNAGKPVLRRFIDSNGFAPSIETVPGRVVAAGAKILVFNPFHSFRPDIELHHLTYKFSLSIPQEAPEFNTTVTVTPQVYRAKTVLSLPVQGKSLIHDGHDFYAHHRRLNTEHPIARDIGFTRNFMRYSLDINPSSDGFDAYQDKGAKNEDWYAWDKPVLATGDGTVVAAGGDERDNIRGGQSYFNGGDVKQAPMKFYGNHVLIDHGNGEFSMLAHLQHGSLLVKKGDKVTRGQPVARIGSSGSSNNPHLHFELRNGAGFQADGLPATFRDFTRHLGSTSLPVQAGPVDTGDMIEAK